MKATINEHGTLEIKAENSLESYALNKWYDNYTEEEMCESTLKIDTISFKNTETTK
jgi:hypothetical protein